MPDNVENLYLLNLSNINGIANKSSNTISGNAVDNTISGGNGDDHLFGVFLYI